MRFKSWSDVGKRLMEIKEEQLEYEKLRHDDLIIINNNIIKIGKILNEMKGGVKDGKRIRTSNRKASRISKKAKH